MERRNDVRHFLSPFRAVTTKYQRSGALNNRNLFLTVLEAGKSKIKVPADSVSGMDCYLVHRCLFAVSSHGGSGV